jgi:hypothetical protein
LKRPLLTVIAALLLVLPAAPETSAGQSTPVATQADVIDPFAAGWAVVVLEERLATIPANEETVVPFKVLCLGRANSEVEGAIVVSVLRHVESDAAVTSIAHASETPELYDVNLMLDLAGDWQWTAFVYNAGSMNPQATFLPALTVVERGGADPAPAPPAATPLPGGPGYITIEDERLSPWHLVVPLGLKVLFANESGYPVLIFVEGEALNVGEHLHPGSSALLWYSTVPGDYLFTTGPAPAFMAGTITVTGEP